MKKTVKTVTAIMAVCMVWLPTLVGCGGKSKSSGSAASSNGNSGNAITVKADASSTKKSEKANAKNTSTKAPEPNPITDFEYDFNKDGETLYIKKYNGDSETVVFPAKIEGFPVTIIGNPPTDNYVLHERVKDVVIPEGVTEIWPHAFGGHQLSSLSTVQLPITLKKIGAKAFENCTSLKKIVIPAGVEEIAEGAFHGCKNLKEVVLPDTLKVIGGAQRFGALEGTFASTAIEKIVIPASVEEIGEKAFSGCKNLKEVVLPDTLKVIGNYAFAYCSITDVNIPASIKYIGIAAFVRSPIPNLIVPDSIQSIKFGEPNSAGAAFKDCQQIPLLVRKRLQELGYKYEF